MMGRTAAAATVLGALLLTCAFAGSDVFLDNDSVRVSFNTYLPDELSGDHEHVAPRFVYVLAGGTLESVTSGGQAQSTTMTPGSCMYAAPIRHSVRNTGETTLRLVEIEIKDAPGPRDGKTQRCLEPANDPDPPRANHIQRTILFAGPDLIVSRIVIPPGSKDRAGSIRGPRVVVVLEGGPLATRTAGGSKAIATISSALWVGAEASLANQDSHAPLVVLEITPTASSTAPADSREP